MDGLRKWKKKKKVNWYINVDISMKGNGDNNLINFNIFVFQLSNLLSPMFSFHNYFIQKFRTRLNTSFRLF